MNKKVFPIILTSFFLSGFSALLYQVLWTRLITLFFGHTTLAITTILAIFMAGLAAGSYVTARFNYRFTKHQLLFIYICCQLFLAFYGFISNSLINKSLEFVTSMPIAGLHFSLQYFIWVTVSFILLIIPTTVMGATFPVLLHIIFPENKDSQGIGTGWLMGANTLGSVFGVFLSGYLLIPLIGLKNSLSFAVSGNIISGLIIYFGLLRESAGNNPAEQIPIIKEQTLNIPSSNLFFVLLFVFGFTGMALEVAWTRIFITILGSSTYAFTNVIMIMLLGLASGNASLGFVKKIISVNLKNMIFIQTAIALLVLITLPLFNFIPYLFVRIVPIMTDSKGIFYLIEFLICFIIIFAPAFLMGLSFPWIVQLVSEENSNAAEFTGKLYALNCIGSVAGAFASGFVWLPIVGVEKTFLMVLILYIFLISVLWVFISIKQNPFFAAAPIIIILGVIFVPRWDPVLISSGMFLYAPFHANFGSYKEFKEAMHKNKVLYYKDGISSTITVLEDPSGDRFMRVNSKTDASSSFDGDMSTQIYIGYLPILFYSGKPESALVIGFGSGVTVSAVSSFKSLSEIHCVEIEPLVKQTACLFKDVNLDVLSDKRLKLFFTDARQYLKNAKNKYDIIISEPSNPWIAGIANLYTREAFELVKDKLSEKGVFCQWIHSYSMSESDFKMVLKTFISVFPNSCLFMPKTNDYLLIGSVNQLGIDYSNLLDIFKSNLQFRTDMEALRYNHPFVVISNTYLLDSNGLNQYTKNAPVHLDDKPVLEFSAPMSLHRKEDKTIYMNIQKLNKKDITGVFTNFKLSADEWIMLYNSAGETCMKQRDPYQAEIYFRKALELNGRDARTIVNIGRVKNSLNSELQAEELFKKAISINPRYSLAYFHLGMLYITGNLEDKGLTYLKKGLQLSPYDPFGVSQVAQIYTRRGEKEKARKILFNAISQSKQNSYIKKNLQRQMQEID